MEVYGNSTGSLLEIYGTLMLPKKRMGMRSTFGQHYFLRRGGGGSPLKIKNTHNFEIKINQKGPPSRPNIYGLVPGIIMSNR